MPGLDRRQEGHARPVSHSRTFSLFLHTCPLPHAHLAEGVWLLSGSQLFPTCITEPSNPENAAICLEQFVARQWANTTAAVNALQQHMSSHGGNKFWCALLLCRHPGREDRVQRPSTGGKLCTLLRCFGVQLEEQHSIQARLCAHNDPPFVHVFLVREAHREHCQVGACNHVTACFCGWNCRRPR